MSESVVFIGLGNMGLPMAVNLAKAGVRVAGHDLVVANVERLVAAGGARVDDLAQAVRGASVVVTMLPASRHVEAAYLGEAGIVAQASPGTLLVDCSTIAPEASRRVARAAAARGLAMIDAPVSGGTAGAAGGTLTFMVGGDADDVERARPLLERMGRSIFHAGAHGAGQTVKICNNMMLGIQMIGACEAIRLGVANGMDPKVLSEVMTKSSGRNWVLEGYNPCPGVMENVPASRGYNGGFGVDLMLKDLGLAVENALACGAAVPLGALARNLFDLHSKAGSGGLDFSSIYRMLAPAD
ncbi:MAG: 3-hydroxyisobutyrate dehydrogenase [Pseudomonadota bacterium]|jgi:3-hydroxyisobutyrate dehydrogenase